MNDKQIIELIKQQGGLITGQIIKDQIKQHESENKRMKKLYKEYLSDVSIKDRVFQDPTKVNSKLNNDYRGDIIDGITGYMFGEPITYSVDSDKLSEVEKKRVEDALNEFKARNDIEDLDSTTGEMMSICGYAARLLYVDKDGKERAMNIKPWEVIFVMDPTIDETQYGMIYYDIELVEGDQRKTRTKVEWYDSKNVTYFISNDDKKFVLDGSVFINPQPHLFNYVPLIKFVNNNAQKGDFEKVGELIDAYDRVVSDIQNEVEEFRLAYLAFYGVEPTPEVVAAARQTGAFHFPEGTDGKFITKPLDDAAQFIENHKKTLNDNIYKFSKAVDMRDEEFSGSAMSGESRKWKLVGLENRAKTKERKFIKGLRSQFKVLSSAWIKREIKLNYEDLSFKFSRNLPVDLKYHAEVTANLRGNVSEETRLAIMPFIDDPIFEIEKMKEDQGDLIDFDNIPDEENDG